MNTSTDRKLVHTILAFAILALFVVSSLAPYFIHVPDGQGGNLIVSNAETIKNVMLLVVGYYFGSTAMSTKRSDMLTEKALGPSGSPAPGTARVEAAADVDVTVRDAGPDAGELPADQRVQP